MSHVASDSTAKVAAEYLATGLWGAVGLLLLPTIFDTVGRAEDGLRKARRR